MLKWWQKLTYVVTIFLFLILLGMKIAVWIKFMAL